MLLEALEAPAAEAGGAEDPRTVFDDIDLRGVSGTVPERFNLGNFAHANAERLIPESERPRGLEKEFTIDLADRGRIRVDRIDVDKGKVNDIKPDTPEWISKGRRQVDDYAHWLDIYHPRPNGEKWEGEVVTYDMDRLKKAFHEVGELSRWITGDGK